MPSIQVNVRPANSADLPTLRDLFYESSAIHTHHISDQFRRPSEKFVDDYFLKHLSERQSQVLVGVHERNVVGYARTLIKDFPQSEMHVPGQIGRVEDIVISEKYRRQGVGAILLKACENWVMGQGVFQIELNVWAFNENAIRFYERLDYVPARTVYAKKLT